MLINKITKWLFPCERRLNEKLEIHKQEVEKLIAEIKRSGLVKTK